MTSMQVAPLVPDVSVVLGGLNIQLLFWGYASVSDEKKNKYPPLYVTAFDIV